MEFIIKTATKSEVAAIAKLHIDCWRESYEGIVPESYLNTLCLDEKKSLWKNVIDSNNPVYIAIDTKTNKVIGFSNAGKHEKDNAGVDATLYAIYLSKEYHGKGVGKLLFNHSFSYLKSKKCKKVDLWVFNDNPTYGFYAHMNGKVIDEEIDVIDNVSLKESRFCWDL